MKKIGTFLGRKLRKNKNTQPKDTQIRSAVTFESLEPRLLLSADVNPLAAVADQPAAAPTEQTVSIDLSAAELSSPATVLLDVPTDAKQYFFLDFDGARDVTYQGPVTIDGVEVTAFTAPSLLQGQETDVIDSILALLNGTFANSDFVFGVQLPSSLDEPYSTIYVGGNSPQFDAYGKYLGVAESVDTGNQNRSDIAFVFADLLDAATPDVQAYASSVAEIIAHEAGHLMGYEHAHTVHTDDASDVLAEVAFKPYTHVEIVKDVRQDILDDGMLTIAGENYALHPRVLDAIVEYPDYFYGGSIGPDGFADLIYGQSVIHGASTGVWLGHLMDMAWAAQQSDAYSEPEKLQILSWTYGFLAHAAGDLWSHTLVNEFAEGVFPTFADVLTNTDDLANAVRHILTEEYIADATPGFDKNSDRTLTPTGDVSDDGTHTIEIKAPVRFIYEALIKNVPDQVDETSAMIDVTLPTGEVVRYLTEGELKFSAASPLTTVAELEQGIVSASLRDEFKGHDILLANDSQVVTNLDGYEWEIRSDFREFELRLNQTTGALEVFEIHKTRGAPIDTFLALRERLVELVANAPVPADPNFSDPLQDVVNELLDAGNRFLRGETVDTDALIEKFKDVFDGLQSIFLTTIGDILNNRPVSPDNILAVGTSYLQFWIDNIDKGLQNWGEIGLAISRTFFSPEAYHNLQNWEAQSYGADVPDVDGNLDAFARRGERETDNELIDIFDVLESALEDPNQDRITTDSYINQYLLGMLGLPPSVGDLRAGFQGFILELRTKVLDPAIEVLPEAVTKPITDLIDYVTGFIQEQVKDFIFAQIEKRYGVDLEVYEFLTEIPELFKDVNVMDITGLVIDGELIPLFADGARQKLDGYLGFTGTNHLKVIDTSVFPESIVLPDGKTISLVLSPFATGGLLDNAEFDKSKFYAYADSVTMSQMLLLMEYDPLTGSVGGTGTGELSRLMANLIGQPYDFSKLSLNGNYGGNIMTATLPLPGETVPATYFKNFQAYSVVLDVDARPWLTSIDAGFQWRRTNFTLDPSSDEYFAGTGNFALWQSEMLRPAFRQLFLDWIDPSADPMARFPDHGDLAVSDPNTDPLRVSQVVHAPTIALFDLAPSPSLPAGISIVVNGDENLVLTGDLVIGSIMGDGQGVLDNLVVTVDGGVLIAGNVGGAGLHNLTIQSNQKITIADNSVVSVRQISDGADAKFAVSIGDSGNLTFIAPIIELGNGVSLLAQADAGFGAGDIRLESSQSVDETWSFLGIDGFKWNSAVALIRVGSAATIAGRDVTLTSSATTRKKVDLEQDFARSTTAAVYRDVDGDGDLDLIVGNDGQTNRLYLNDGTGTFGAGIDITADAQATRALALGDVDGDGDLDLIVGNNNDTNRIYLNMGGGVFAAGRDITPDVNATTAIALGDIDGDGDLDVASGNDRQVLRVYETELGTGTPGFYPGQDLDVDAQIVQNIQTNGGLTISDAKAVGVVAESLARVDVGAGAQIYASRNVSLDAQANASAEITTKRSAWGVTYGSASPTAEVIVENGAEIIALGDFSMNARANNELNVTTFVPSLGEQNNIAVSLGRAVSTSRADVDAGASIAATNASITAENHTSFQNNAVAAGFGNSDGSSNLSATAALSYNRSIATASVSGNVNVTNDLAITGRSMNDVDNTRSFGSASGNPFGDLANSINDFFTGTPFEKVVGEKTLKFRQAQTADNAYAFSVATAEVDNVANALIGDGANIIVGGNLHLHSEAKDAFQISASSSVGTFTPVNDLAATGAFAYSAVANQANTFIGYNALVDVGHTLDANAIATIASPVSALDLALNLLGFGQALTTEAIGAVDAFGGALGSSIKNQLDQQSPVILAGVLESADKTGTSFVNSGGAVGDDGTTIGGGVNILNTYNAATAAVASGSRINQRTALADASQDVSIRADGNTDLVNLAGDFSVLHFLTSEAGTSFGGFYESILNNNYATAYIDDLTKVSAARNINVNAATRNRAFALAEAGDQAKSYGVDGAVVNQDFVNRTNAYIEDRANVHSGFDVGLNAASDVRVTSLAGAMGMADTVGVGIGAAFTQLDNATRAFVGDAKLPVGAGGYGGVQGQVTSDAGNIGINADSEIQSVSFGIAAAFAEGSDSGSGGESSEGDRGFGFGISGDVGLNEVKDDTQAFVRDNVTVSTPGNLNVEADSNGTLVAAAGGVIDSNSAALGGSNAQNLFEQTTSASIANASVNASNTAVTADSDYSLVGISVGVGLETKYASVMGSANNNRLVNNTEAYIGDYARITGNTLGVTARNNTLLVSIAGNYADSQLVSVGGALDLNRLETNVHAWIGEAATVGTTGNVSVDAKNDVLAISIAAAIGVASDSGLAGTGSLVRYVVEGDVSAYVEATGADGGYGVDAGGQLNITAHSDTNAGLIAGNVASGSSAGVGGSLATMTGKQRVAAFLADGARISAATGLNVNADTSDDMVTVAVGGSFADTFVASGSFADNDIANVTEAFIGANAVARVAAGTARVSARDNSRISAAAGAFAFSDTVAVGISRATNKIHEGRVAAYVNGASVEAASLDLSAQGDQTYLTLSASGSGSDTGNIAGAISHNDVVDNRVEAFITGPTAIVVSTGLVAVAANDNAHVYTLSGAGAGSESFALAGVESKNTIERNLTQAYIDNGAQVQSGSSVQLGAHDNKTIMALTGSGAGADSVAIGYAKATNQVADTAKAYVDNAHITTGTLQLVADTSQQIDAIAATGAGADTLAGTFSDSLNQVSNTTDAFIVGSNTTIHASDSISILARNGSDTKVTSGAGGGASQVALGETRSRNEVANTIAAHINGNADIRLDGSISVHATDASKMRAYIGNGNGAATGSLGAADAKNTHSTITTAYIENAHIEASAVDVLAESHAKVTATVVAGGGAETFAGAYVESRNEISNTTEARISANAEVIAGTIAVSAFEDALIRANSHAGTGAGTLSLEGARARNIVHNNVKALIDSATIHAGNVFVLAGQAPGDVTDLEAPDSAPSLEQNDPRNNGITETAVYTPGVALPTGVTGRSRIEAYTIAGGGAGYVAGAVADAKNDIGNTTDAHISNVSDFIATGSINVSAFDETSIRSLTIGGAGAGLVAAGFAESKNYTTNTTEAYTRNVTLQGDDLIVHADNRSTIESLGIGAAGSGAFAGGYSSVVNAIHDSTMASIGPGSTVTMMDTVDVVAIDTAKIRTHGGQGSGATYVAGGGTVVESEIGSQTSAFVDNATVTARTMAVKANLPLDASDPNPDEHRAIIESLAISGNGAAIAGYSGATAKNTITTETTAFLSNGSVINASDQIDVVAVDNAIIKAHAGAGAGAAIVAGAVVDATNAIDYKTRAYTNDAALTSNVVNVEAHGGSRLDVSIHTGAGAAIGSYSSAESQNILGTDALIDASIGSGTTINAQTAVNVLAKDASDIDAWAGAGSAAIIASGSADAINLIGHSIKAHTESTTIVAGALNINAQSDSSIDALAVGYGGGGLFANDAKSVNTINDHVEAYTGVGTNAQIAGNVAIHATAGGTIDNTAGSLGNGAVIEFGNAIAESYVNGAVDAHVQGHLIAGGNVAITADSDQNVETSSIAGSLLEVAAIRRQTAISNVTPTLSSYVADDGVIEAGSVTLRSQSEGQVEAYMDGLSISAVTSAGGTTIANFAPTVKTFLSAGAQVAASGAIVLESMHNTLGRETTAGGSTVSVGFAGFEQSAATANANADVDAFIAQGALVGTTGTVTLRATSQNLAHAQEGLFQGALLVGDASVDALANATGNTRAHLDGDLTAGSLVIEATSAAHSRSQTRAGSVGILSDRDANSRATTSPHSATYIHDGVVVNTTGNIQMTNTTITDADASAVGKTLSLLGDGGSGAVALVDPIVENYVGKNVVVNAGGNFVMSTRAGQPPATSSGTFDPATAVDNLADTIHFAEPHGLFVGDEVVYDNGGGDSIDGLVSGRTYKVIDVVDDTTVRLGATFYGQDPLDPYAGVDAAQDVIRFSLGHSFETGDRVVYTADGGTAVPGLVNGGTYYVRVLNNGTIKLANTLEAATSAPTDLAVSDINALTNVISITDHGFANNQAITYLAPESQTFIPELVDVRLDADGEPMYGPAPANGGLRLPEHDPASNNIILEAHGYETGAMVTYWTEGSAVGGLTDRTNYFVIKVNDDTIQLASSAANAAAGIAIGIDGAAATGTQHIALPGQMPIAGLVNGRTYYVKRIDANSFALANSPGGTTIDLVTTGVSGGHQLFDAGINLGSLTGSAMHQLRLDLDATTATGSQHRLIGVGGAGSLLTIPSGFDGIASSVATGAQVGLAYAKEGATAITVASAQVNTFVDSGASITAGQDVRISSNSAVRGKSYATTDGASLFVTSGNSGAFVTTTQLERVSAEQQHVNRVDVLGGAQILAGHDAVITTDTTNFVSAYSDTHGGSLIYSSGGASALAESDYISEVRVLGGAAISAGNLADLRSKSGVSASLYANANTKSLVAGSAKANGASVLVGERGGAVTRTIIANGGHVEAATVHLDANTASLYASSYANAKGGGLLGGKARAHAKTQVDTRSEVLLQAGADVYGRESVRIDAQHNNVDTWAEAHAKKRGLFGSARASIEHYQNTYSLITVDENAVIRTKDLLFHVESNLTGRGQSFLRARDGLQTEIADTQAQITAIVTDPNYDPNDPPAQLFVLIERLDELQTVLDLFDRFFPHHISPNRTITFNGDAVILLDTIDPLMTVDEFGNVITQGDITFTQTGDQIVVDDITNTNSKAGTIRFEAEPIQGARNRSELEGNRGVITFRMAYDNVRIENASSKDLIINNIDPIAYNVTPRVEIAVENVPDGADPDFPTAFEFDLVRDYRSTIEIQNTGNRYCVVPTQCGEGDSDSDHDGSTIEYYWCPPALIINGLINNPQGATILYNYWGDIVSSGAQGVIRTNYLNATSWMANVGDRVVNPLSTDRLNVELVRSVTGPQKALIELATGLDVYAGQDATLNVLGRLRDDPATVPTTINLGAIYAGDDVDINFLEGTMVAPFADPTPEAVPFATDVVETLQDPELVTKITTHFRPTPGDVAAPYLAIFGTDALATEITYDTTLISAGDRITLNGPTTGLPVNITANTDILGSGYIDAATTGDIRLTEIIGDMRIGYVTSLMRDVWLTAENGSIIDIPAESNPDVRARSVTLKALNGGIGTASNYFEIDSSNPTAGLVNATARDSIYLTETAGDLNVDLIASLQSDVTLRTRSGAIADGRNDGATNVAGVNIKLFPVGGGVGSEDNDLDINSSNVATGQVTSEAVASIYLNETTGPLNAWRVLSTGANVRLTATDTTDVDNNIVVLGGGLVQGAGTVTLRAGDDLYTSDSSRIQAGGAVTLMGDFGNADPGVGSVMDLRGTIIGKPITVYGNVDNDTILFNETYLVGTTHVYAGAGDDYMHVNRLQTMDVKSNGAGDTLTLDGQDGSDTYRITLVGDDKDPKNTARAYIVNVLDTGTTGTDNLIVDGSDWADNFLLHKLTSIPGEVADGPATIKLDHSNSNWDGEGSWTSNLWKYEQINYDRGINGQLQINGYGGDDVFLIDDMAANAVIDAGSGNDEFVVGQLYNKPRTADYVSANEAFETTATTQGYLSNGVTLPAVLIGGDGNDQFAISNHQASLTLYGDGGRDNFDVRAYYRTDGTIVQPNGQIGIFGGADNDTVEIDSPAPTAVDGGGGYDQLSVTATSADDNFVITDGGVFGGNRYVTYTGTERVDLDGGSGNNRFYVQSTAAGVDTRLYGGSDNDVFNIAGDIDQPIIADDPNVAGYNNTLTFPSLPHVLTRMAGGLTIDGGQNNSKGRDVLSFYNDGSTTNDSGVLSGTAFAGFGMGGDLAVTVNDGKNKLIFRGGASYKGIEEINVRLGTGADTLYVKTKDGQLPKTVNIYRDASDTVIYINTSSGHDLTAGDIPTSDISAENNLTVDQLNSIVDEAKRRWAAVLSPADVEAALANVEFEIVDLDDQTLATVVGNKVLVDINAAGFGWFVDTTPADDSEFGAADANLSMVADPNLGAPQGMDLLTVLLHEIGHVLGLEHDEPTMALMSPTLFIGQRKVLASTSPDAPVIDWGGLVHTGEEHEENEDYVITQPDWVTDFVAGSDTAATTDTSLVVVLSASPETSEL